MRFAIIFCSQQFGTDEKFYTFLCLDFLSIFFHLFIINLFKKKLNQKNFFFFSKNHALPVLENSLAISF